MPVEGLAILGVLVVFFLLAGHVGVQLHVVGVHGRGPVPAGVLLEDRGAGAAGQRAPSWRMKLGLGTEPGTVVVGGGHLGLVKLAVPRLLVGLLVLSGAPVGLGVQFGSKPTLLALHPWTIPSCDEVVGAASGGSRAPR